MRSSISGARRTSVGFTPSDGLPMRGALAVIGLAGNGSIKALSLMLIGYPLSLTYALLVTETTLMTFQLDTTGEGAKPGAPVAAPNDVSGQCSECGRDNQGYEGEPCSDDCPSRSVAWEELGTFTQGYIEAMPWEVLLGETYSLGCSRAAGDAPGFSDLAPEALSRIIEDCAAFLASGAGEEDSDHGRRFWAMRVRRQVGGRWHPRFPPLNVLISTDGKVGFA